MFFTNCNYFSGNIKKEPVFSSIKPVLPKRIVFCTRFLQKAFVIYGIGDFACGFHKKRLFFIIISIILLLYKRLKIIKQHE